MQYRVSFHAKNRKAYQGSLQVSSTNESGVRALALPHPWVLLGSRETLIK